MYGWFAMHAVVTLILSKRSVESKPLLRSQIGGSDLGRKCHDIMIVMSWRRSAFHALIPERGQPTHAVDVQLLPYPDGEKPISTLA
jgi:hypothetical protein